MKPTCIGYQLYNDANACCIHKSVLLSRVIALDCHRSQSDGVADCVCVSCLTAPAFMFTVQLLVCLCQYIHLVVAILLLKLGLCLVLFFRRVPRSSSFDGSLPSPDILQSLGLGPLRVKVHGFLHVDL